VGTAKLLNSTILENSRTPFVLELPEYRLPRPRSLGMMLVERAQIFLTQVGTVVLGVSFAIWMLVHLPIRAGHLAAMHVSLLARAGHWIEPLVRPLGFDWKIAVGLLTSFVAREVMVGTLGTIYGAEPGAASQSLAAGLHRDLTLPGALALLVFFALAMQCTSTFAVVRRETNSWRWPILQFVYMGTLAYACAWIVNVCLSHIL
jgi:ferrous iron transport protein B